jgi:uncharacterized protein YndB with AHSA1/START domain
MPTISPDNDAIIEEIFINAPPERVFRALTDPEQLVAWWGDTTQYWCTSWTLDLRVGGKWRSEGRSVRGGAFVVEGEFLEIDPPRVLCFTWLPNWVDAKPTKVRIVLEPQGQGTLVRWTHSGFAGNRTALDDHRHGLPSVVRWLQAFLEQGRTIPHA